MREKRVFSHLSLYEREQIFVHKQLGKSLRDIGKLLNRPHSTISRELGRNNHPHPLMQAYIGPLAHQQAQARKKQSAKRPRLKHQMIRDYVQQQMQIGWTPELIAHQVPFIFKGFSISHEAIYQYVYIDWREGIILLPQKRQKRYAKRYCNRRNRAPIPNRIDIDFRPQKINKRRELGHLESDSVESDQSKVIYNVMVERFSRLVKITRLNNKTAALTKDAIVARLQSLPQKARRSITYDNGTENYYHEEVNKALNTKSFFCKPYHSWEKGSVENINGLIRRFIPKKTDLANFSQEQLDVIENLLNHRPRKCLGYKTPAQVFLKITGAIPP